jgi:ComF family protein
MTILSSLLSLCAPHHCLVCGSISEPHELCRRCKATPISTKFRCRWCWELLTEPSRADLLCILCRTSRAIWYRQRFLHWYTGNARSLIHQMKFRPDKGIAALLGKQLASAIPKLFQGLYWDILVPIPSSPQNFLQRKFHPCEAMVYEIERRLPGCTVRTDLLHYSAHASAQGNKSIRDRLSHPTRSFRSVAQRLDSVSILLIDDVLTTGATLSSASTVLLKAGARRVDLITYCRSERWREYRSHLPTYRKPV